MNVIAHRCLVQGTGGGLGGGTWEHLEPVRTSGSFECKK